MFKTILNLSQFTEITPSENIAGSFVQGENIIYTDVERFKTIPAEPVYIYTDIIKPNLVGDSYVGLLTPIQFPSPKGYHRFDYPLYRPLEKHPLLKPFPFSQSQSPVRM
jgi:hypothetical protein